MRVHRCPAEDPGSHHSSKSSDTLVSYFENAITINELTRVYKTALTCQHVSCCLSHVRQLLFCCLLVPHSLIFPVCQSIIIMAKKSAGGAGKFVNPTDKARKDARKKELKKNKKQRLAVRTNVIKAKDPHQILADMRRLDQMEFNPEQPSPLNDKVLGDKRRKLKETWDRVMHLYSKDDREKFVQLKRLQDEYENDRNQMRMHYEAVKSAQNVQLEEIPLPSLPTAIPESAPILKKAPSLTTYRNLTQKDPPGPPPGPPPALSEFPDEDTDSGKKVRFDNDVDEFLKEIADFVPPAANPAMSLPIAAVPAPAVIRNPLILVRPPQLNAVPPPAPVMPPAGLRPPVPGYPRMRMPQTGVKLPDKNRHVATIEAKPQLRNLSADATRFTPLSLRVKRTEKRPVPRPLTSVSSGISMSSSVSGSESGTSSGSGGQHSKEAAYEDFMRELQGLI